ncbi:MAG: hypothetical protein SFX73_38495 [Kofleriaceae bacterium]|nr:hypothetical protein [Kofleriaceae bacterium]
MTLTRAGTAAMVALASFSGCQIEGTPLPPAEHGTFPYHPLVFELDLAILAYQLHGQSLVWPIDPYYEEHAGDRGTPRETMLALVRDWAVRRGETQAPGFAGYRGPGVLARLPDNPTHDPIIYDYARLHPWSSTIVNLEDQWTEYLTPREVTGRIRDVYVSARPIGGDGASVELVQLVPARPDWDPDATDVLLAFEGATGDRGDDSKPASYSLMGFVLVRDTVDGGYDVHVTFRGSRSGNATRAALDALDSRDAKGNPDWVTDLAWDVVHVEAGASDVTTVGAVHRGFARSMKADLPGVFQCLAKAAELRGRAPTNIYVTGHSLGGGLAQHFTSAVLLGDAYGPDGAGPAMPEALRAWPWPQIKLVTYSAPRAGDHAWATALSGKALDSPFYAPGPLETVDAEARLVVDPSITARLHDATRPAGLRVLVSTDPITTTRLGGDGNHIGTTVYVNGTGFLDWFGVVSSVDHEPEQVRAYMTDAFADDERNPAVAWRYLPVDELVPERDAGAKGTPLELAKLAAGLRRYYTERALWFDDAAFTRDLELRFAIERGDAP